MKKSLTYLTFINMIAILLLSVSGLFNDGPVSRVLYLLSFLLPVLLAYLLKRRVKYTPPRLVCSGREIGLAAPFIAPSVALVFLLSYLTSLLLGLFGKSDSVELSGSVTELIFNHAFLPALLEEALYRYVPIALLSGYSRRGAVIYSSLFFAFAHCNLFQIPYALVAGFVFVLLDLAFDSILPSLLLHFVNNTLSILWILWGVEHILTFALVLVALALLSLVLIALLYKRHYRERIARALDKGESAYSGEVLLYFGLTLAVAILNITGGQNG